LIKFLSRFLKTSIRSHLQSHKKRRKLHGDGSVATENCCVDLVRQIAKIENFLQPNPFKINDRWYLMEGWVTVRPSRSSSCQAHKPSTYPGSSELHLLRYFVRRSR
jgi:hypothetical protein